MHRALLPLLATLMVTPALAEEGFRSSDNCLETLNSASDVDKVLLGAWVMGFLDNTNEQDSLVRLDNTQVVLKNLTRVCARNPEATILDVVNANQKNTPDTAGTDAHARAFLEQFLRPEADRTALTAGLRPTEAEIRAIYASPLAERLVAMYDEMYQPGIQIGPKAGQTQVLLWRGTTRSLREGDPVLADFPGGYKEVRGMLQGNFPIFRFKFVEPGKTTGMAFDGLIWTGERYVLLPKPWRAAE